LPLWESSQVQGSEIYNAVCDTATRDIGHRAPQGNNFGVVSIMAEKPNVKIYLDLVKYNDVLTDKFAMILNTRVRKFAKAIVASPWNQNAGYASGDLADSIRTEGLGKRNYQTVAGGVMGTNRPGPMRKTKKARMIAYALAQEYGRPDMAKYTFRPYMRPAAEQAVESGTLSEVLAEATDAAIKAATIGK